MECENVERLHDFPPFHVTVLNDIIAFKVISFLCRLKLKTGQSFFKKHKQYAPHHIPHPDHFEHS